MASGLAAMWSDTGETHEALVAQVKEQQRSNPVAKEQWAAYTDLHGQGRRDPVKHDANFLSGFLMHMRSGQLLPAGAGMDDSMGEAIKLLQKKSPSFKTVWSHFCLQYGGGFHDPLKHDAQFQLKFMENLAQQAALGAMGGAVPSGGVMGADGQNPAKRMRTGPSGDPMKDSLVAQVKGFQREGQLQKDLWTLYADTYLGGVRAPARHESSVLSEFCINHHVPPAQDAPPPGGGGACAGMGGGPVVGGSFAATSGSNPYKPIGPLDPEKQMIVDRIKAWQRGSPENKEVWVQFCGSTRDPARHDLPKLQEFCRLCNIP